jgi:hypothetical protein
MDSATAVSALVVVLILFAQFPKMPMEFLPKKSSVQPSKRPLKLLKKGQILSVNPS